jgi:hypothetical protein
METDSGVPNKRPADSGNGKYEIGITSDQVRKILIDKIRQRRKSALLTVVKGVNEATISNPGHLLIQMKAVINNNLA